MDRESEGGAVEYGKCSECGYLMLPVPELTPCGHDAPVVREPLHEQAEVYSWTRLRLGDKDRLMIMGDFFGGELRVTAPMVGAGSVAIGDEVRLVEGGDLPYVFIPVE